jgi:hypothetical protein
MRLYINGVLNASASFAGSIGYSTGSFRMGANANGAELFNGRIFDCFVHERALTANEVWELYQIGRGGMLTPAPSPALFAFPSNPLAIFAASHAAVIGG